MFVTTSFVFLHIPKTGGTFVSRVLRKDLAAEKLGPRHSSYAALAADRAHLPGFYIIRNPWDWYVSWYHHQLETADTKPNSRRKQAIWEQLLDSGRAEFRQAVTRACDGQAAEDWAEDARTKGRDLYSHYVQTIAGPVLDRPDFQALRFERLRDDLLGFLSAHAEVTPSLRAAILERPPRRTSTHGPYREYYDAELYRLVGEKTAWLRERFGYEPEGSAATPVDA